jgi:hypothetical protein
MYKTHDGRRSRDNLRNKEKNKLMQNRQSSTKDLIASLKRVASKRLTQRGHKRLTGLNASKESHKFIKNYNNVTASHNKFTNKENLSFMSPKKNRHKKSVEKSYAYQNLRYIPIEMKTSAIDKSMTQDKSDKKYTYNSSSRGKKRVVKITATSKYPYQASMCNSNTSRKTPVHNTKFGDSKNRASKKILNPGYQKLAQLNGINMRKKLPEMMQNIININTNINANTSIIKNINKKHKNMPKAGIHYRAKTTEIGMARHIKRNIPRKVSFFSHNLVLF